MPISAIPNANMGFNSTARAGSASINEGQLQQMAARVVAQLLQTPEVQGIMQALVGAAGGGTIAASRGGSVSAIQQWQALDADRDGRVTPWEFYTGPEQARVGLPDIRQTVDYMAQRNTMGFGMDLGGLSTPATEMSMMPTMGGNQIDPNMLMMLGLGGGGNNPGIGAMGGNTDAAMTMAGIGNSASTLGMLSGMGGGFGGMGGGMGMLGGMGGFAEHLYAFGAKMFQDFTGPAGNLMMPSQNSGGQLLNHPMLGPIMGQGILDSLNSSVNGILGNLAIGMQQ